LADGAYQRTDDRKKTFVWNNDPQPGDAASWSGGSDSKGYAEGTGTLTWFRTEQKFQTGANIFGTKKVPISRYTGTMAHGKFEGAVVTVDHGKTYHATYADGQRKGRWSSGPVIAKAESAEPPAEKPKESSSGVATAKKTETPESETEAMSADQLEESATPSKPVTKKAALAPGAVRAIDQPGRTAERKTEKAKETTRKQRPAPKPEEPKAEPAEPESEAPAEGPTDTAPSQPSSPNLPASEKPVDDSIRTLTGPPSSLHTKAPPAPSAAPEISRPSAPAASPPPAAPKLNAVQAMDIADIEARTRGYDLGEYQLPKAEYNSANDTWSVSYTGRDGEKSGKRLSVIVQDKSGKAEVKK
jgi:hypothetical protein